MISSFFFPFLFLFFFLFPSVYTSTSTYSLHYLSPKIHKQFKACPPHVVISCIFLFFFFQISSAWRITPFVSHSFIFLFFFVLDYFMYYRPFDLCCCFSNLLFRFQLSLSLSLPSHSLTLKLVNKLTTNPPHLFLVIFIKLLDVFFLFFLLLLPSSPPLSHPAFLTMYILLIRIPYRIVFFLALGRAITCVHSFMEESLNINREFAYNLALDGTA